MTQNAWFCCAHCSAISGEISILIQTGAESWGRFPVPRICRWESSMDQTGLQIKNTTNADRVMSLSWIIMTIQTSLGY